MITGSAYGGGRVASVDVVATFCSPCLLVIGRVFVAVIDWAILSLHRGISNNDVATRLPTLILSH